MGVGWLGHSIRNDEGMHACMHVDVHARTLDVEERQAGVPAVHLLVLVVEPPPLEEVVAGLEREGKRVRRGLSWPTVI